MSEMMVRCQSYEGCHGSGWMDDLSDSGSGATVYCDCLTGQELRDIERAIRVIQFRDARTEVERLRALGADREVLAEQLHAERLTAIGNEAALESQLAERIRRHESDAHDLEQLRVTARDESKRAHDAEVLVDALADALELQLRSRYGLTAVELAATGSAVGLDGLREALAALRLAGRLP